MATIGALSAVVAAATGVNRARVSVLARTLRDRGTILSEGRGYGASVMSPYDAAALLTASMAADTVRQAVETFDFVAELGGVAVAKPTWAKRAVSDLEMLAGKRILFLRVVSDVLRLAAVDRLFPPFAHISGTLPYRPTGVSIVLFGPVPSATITVSGGRFFAGWRFGGLAKCELKATDDIASYYEREVVAPRYRRGYVLRTSRVGEATVGLVAKAIGKEWPPLFRENNDE